MRSLQRALIFIFLFALSPGCHHTGFYRGSHAWETIEFVKPPFAGSWCKYLPCDRVVYIDAECQVTDEAGAVLPIIEMNVGERVCFYNRSSCSVSFSFGDELFGAERAEFDIAADECANLTVNSEASGEEYRIDVTCNCGAHGHTNPQVKVGDEEEGGGG